MSQQKTVRGKKEEEEDDDDKQQREWHSSNMLIYVKEMNYFFFVKFFSSVFAFEIRMNHISLNGSVEYVQVAVLLCS